MAAPLLIAGTVAIAGYHLPGRDQVEYLVQRTVDKMKPEGKPGGFKEGDQPGAGGPHVGVLMRPT